MHPVLIVFSGFVACLGIFTALLFWANWDIITGKESSSDVSTNKSK